MTTPQPKRSMETQMWEIPEDELIQHEEQRSGRSGGETDVPPGLRYLALASFAQDPGTNKPLPMDLIRGLLAWAQRYRLDPWAGHVILFHGKPYVTELGAIANAHRYPTYRGFSTALLTVDECAEMGLSAGTIGFSCQVRDGAEKVLAEDYGWVTPEEIAEARTKHSGAAKYLPLVKSPQLLAKARAVRRAHLRAFPLEGYEAEETT